MGVIWPKDVPERAAMLSGDTERFNAVNRAKFAPLSVGLDSRIDASPLEMEGVKEILSRQLERGQASDDDEMRVAWKVLHCK